MGESILDIIWRPPGKMDASINKNEMRCVKCYHISYYMKLFDNPTELVLTIQVVGISCQLKFLHCKLTQTQYGFFWSRSSAKVQLLSNSHEPREQIGWKRSIFKPFYGPWRVPFCLLCASNCFMHGRQFQLPTSLKALNASESEWDG